MENFSNKNTHSVTIQLQAYFIVFHRHFFLQIKGKILHQQKDYNSLYCDIHFIVVVWKQTCSILEVCMYTLNVLKWGLGLHILIDSQIILICSSIEKGCPKVPSPLSLH